MQRNLKASFSAMLAAANAVQAAKPALALEAVVTDPTDPTATNAPDTKDEDAAAALADQTAASLVDPTSTDLTANPDVVAAAAADPAADNTDGVGATDVVADTGTEPTVDPTSPDPLAGSTDPVTDAMAAADAGTPAAETPPAAEAAAAGEGAEPTKIVVEVNVNGAPAGETPPVEGTLADPAAAPVVDGTVANAGDLPANTPVMVVEPSAGVTVTDTPGVVPVVDPAIAPVVTTPVADVVVDNANPDALAANLLSEEKFVEPTSKHDHNTALPVPHETVFHKEGDKTVEKIANVTRTVEHNVKVVPEHTTNEPPATRDMAHKVAEGLPKTEGVHKIKVDSETGDVEATSHTGLHKELLNTHDPLAKAGTNTGVEVTKDYHPSKFSPQELQIIDGTNYALKDIDVVDAMDVKVVELHGEIAEYESGFKAMDKISEVLHTSAETGGIDDEGARILEIAYEHICEQLHIPTATMGIPSMENFKLPGSRISATTIALEDIKETMTKVWAAIQAGWQKVLEWLGTFFTHLFDANAKLAAQATQIQASVAAVKDEVLNQNIENAGLAKKLANGASVSAQLPQQLLSLNKFAAGVTDTAPALLQKMLENINKLTSMEKDPKVTSEQVGELYFPTIKIAEDYIASLTNISGMKEGGDPSTYGLEAPNEVMSLLLSNTWLGNKVVYAYVPKNGNVQLKTTGFRAGQATADVGEISPTIPVMTPKDINAIAVIVLEYTKNAANAKTYWERFQQVSKLILTSGQTLVNETTDASTKFKNFVSVTKEIRAISSGIQQPAMAIAAGANAAALQYAAISLKALGASAASAAAAAAAPVAAAA